MKSILRCLVILLLLIAALPLIVYAGSSNVTSESVSSNTSIATATASSVWTVTAAPVAYIPQSYSSFFTCVFGVRIFPGADPVGAYSVNTNPDYIPDRPSGAVSGHMYLTLAFGDIPMQDMVFYLNDPDSNTNGLYFATTDSQGYYKIDHVPFGNYDVYYCHDEDAMHSGSGVLIKSISLTASDPDAVVDEYLMPG